MLSNETIEAIRDRLQKLGYIMRGGTGSDIYYITSKVVGFFATETYALILEGDGWKLNDVAAPTDKRSLIEREIRSFIDRPTTSGTTPLEIWKQHTLIELGGIFAGIFEYEKPEEIATRLERIAWELRNHFSDDEWSNPDPGVSYEP